VTGVQTCALPIYKKEYKNKFNQIVKHGFAEITDVSVQKPDASNKSISKNSISPGFIKIENSNSISELEFISFPLNLKVVDGSVSTIVFLKNSASNNQNTMTSTISNETIPFLMFTDYPGRTHSILQILIPYLILNISEIFVFISAVDLTAYQSPIHLRTLTISSVCFGHSFGNILSKAVNFSFLDAQCYLKFWFVVVLSLFNLVYYCLFAGKYGYVKRSKLDHIHKSLHEDVQVKKESRRGSENETVDSVIMRVVKRGEVTQL
jgi:hypothetical protein